MSKVYPSDRARWARDKRQAARDAAMWSGFAGVTTDVETRARCLANSAFAYALAYGQATAAARAHGMATYLAEGGTALQAATA